MDELYNKIIKNPVVKEVCKNNNVTSRQIIESNFNVLEDFVNDYRLCTPGPLSECLQVIPGNKTSLSYKYKKFYIKESKCEHWIFEHEDHVIQSNIIDTDFDRKTLALTLKKMVLIQDEKVKSNESKKEFINRCNKKIAENDFNKGVYLYGLPGTGKTFLLKGLAASLAENGKKVIIITVNKLVKSVKESFSTNIRNTLYKQSMDCDALLLDDIGGEVVSDWLRDDLLFSLLNYRMEHKKVTFFTSNFDVNKLGKIYSTQKTANPEITATKAVRLVERIKVTCEVMQLNGENLRT